MSNFISGVEVAKLRDSIGEVSRLVEIATDGYVSVDTTGIDPQRTPEKGYDGRCDVPWRTKGAGGIAGTFAFIIFGFRNGTGNESERINLSSTTFPDGVPQLARALPRPKGSVAAEFCLSVATFDLESSSREAAPNAVHLDELLLDPSRNRVISGGYVGLSRHDYGLALYGQIQSELNATYTTGYGRMADPGKLSGTRFGDPHAIFNHQGEYKVQVAGFTGAQGDQLAEFARMATMIGVSMPEFAAD